MGKDEDEFVEKHFGILDPPPGLEWIWQLFLELHSSRMHSSSGFQPLQNTQIDAWSRISMIPLEFWEFQVLRSLDNVWINWHGTKGNGSTQTEKPKRSKSKRQR